MKENSLIYSVFTVFHLSVCCSVRYHLRAILDVLPGSESGGVIPPDDIPQGLKYFTIIGPHVDCNEQKYLVSEWVGVWDKYLCPKYSGLLPRTLSLAPRNDGDIACAVASRPPHCAASWRGAPTALGKRSSSSRSSRTIPRRRLSSRCGWSRWVKFNIRKGKWFFGTLFWIWSVSFNWLKYSQIYSRNFISGSIRYRIIERFLSI